MQALFVSRWIPAKTRLRWSNGKDSGTPIQFAMRLPRPFRSPYASIPKRFGTILHHNVDKALLCGGRAAPSFGGGTVLFPIHIHLGGRAVSDVGGDHIPITEIAVEN